MSTYLEQYQQLRAAHGGGHNDTIGLRMLAADEQRVTAALDFGPIVATPDWPGWGGVGFHAGALMALADHVAVIACEAALDPTGTDAARPLPVTIQFNVHLMRNTGEGSATAVARVVHRGRTLMVAETMVTDIRGRSLMLATSTHALIACAPA